MVDELGEREREVLRMVVQEYISSGDPVGSSQLAKRPEFEVSSATMRNVMADLEALGFLEKPHTSAGRVPTDLGYRFYCDSLLQLQAPLPKERELIQGIAANAGTEEALQEATKVLHFLSKHAGVVLTPRPSSIVFERIEFLRLRDDRVLAILVGQNGQVQNKLVSIDFPMSPEELVRAGNFLNDLLQKVRLEELRGKILSELELEKAQYDNLAAKALKLAAAATERTTNAERVLIEGAGSFLDAPEFADVERMKALFKALDEKNKLLALLDRVQRAKEMQIFIGAESDFSSAGDVSVIASPYRTGETVLGTVGVIGPTRMNYQRIIPLVNFTAQVLSRVLEQI